jgi:hypothetical protein
MLMQSRALRCGPRASLQLVCMPSIIKTGEEDHVVEGGLGSALSMNDT